MFRFSGRIRRMTLWVNGLINIAFYLIVIVIGSASDSAIVALVLILLYLVLAVRGFSLSARRWRYLDRSGAWVLIGTVPTVGSCYSLVLQGFVQGNRGPNRYGPEPDDKAAL